MTPLLDKWETHMLRENYLSLFTAEYINIIQLVLNFVMQWLEINLGTMTFSVQNYGLLKYDYLFMTTVLCRVKTSDLSISFT